MRNVIVLLVLVMGIYSNSAVAGTSAFIVISGRLKSFDSGSIMLTDGHGKTWRLPRSLIADSFDLRPEKKMVLQVLRADLAKLPSRSGA